MTTSTTNQGLVLPTDADLNDVPTAMAAYNTGVESRLVQRYLNSTDRAARNPSPTEGELSYLAAEDRYDWYNASSWQIMFGQGAWTAYTPTWSVTSGVASSLGNGTLSGRYQQIGKTVHFVAQITMGSTTTYATSQWTLSLPVPAVTSASLRPTIHGRIFDSSGGGSAWVAQSWISGTGDFMILEAQGTGSVTAMNQGLPITYAVGDTVTMQGTYEAA